MSLNNQTLNNSTSISTTIVVLDLVQQRFIHQLPLIITLLGLIGFIGNAFTFLQPTLRSNSFCIYTLAGSFIDIINLFINLFPNFLYPEAGNLVSAISISFVCKLKLFALVFLPQLSLNLLIMSLIDRYACTFPLTSPIRRLLQLKMVPSLITITLIVSCVMSFYSPLLNDITPGFGCSSTNPTLDAVLYISIHGIITPVVMSIIVFLTYRQFKQSRQRVVSALILFLYLLQLFVALLQGVLPIAGRNQNHVRNQFITMAFTQVFVTSFFVMQWIGFYLYFSATLQWNKSAEEWAVIYFVLSLTNNLYYMINVRSFYLSTMTSRLFRGTFIKGLLQLFPEQFQRCWNRRN